MRYRQHDTVAVAAARAAISNHHARFKAGERAMPAMPHSGRRADDAMHPPATSMGRKKLVSGKKVSDDV